jgi:hypothetical protein
MSFCILSLSLVTINLLSAYSTLAKPIGAADPFLYSDINDGVSTKADTGVSIDKRVNGVEDVPLALVQELLRGVNDAVKNGGTGGVND